MKLRYLILLSFFIQSCIENDLPYPKVIGEILFIEFEGQTETAEILPDQQYVNVKVDPLSDLSSISIDSIAITEGASISPDPFSIKNFSDNVEFTISTYQDYQWTVNVEKELPYIEINNFEVEGQITTQIDYDKRIIKTLMPEGSDLTNLNIKSFIYQPEKYTLLPDYRDVYDLSDTVLFLVENVLEWKVIATIEEDIIVTDFTIVGQITSFINYEHNLIEVVMPSSADLSNLTIDKFQYYPESAEVYPGREVTDFTGTIVFLFNNEIEWSVEVTKEVIEKEQVPFSDFTQWFQMGDSEQRSYYLPGLTMDSPWRSGDKGASEVNIPTFPKTALPYPSIKNSEGAVLETKTVTIFKILASGSLFIGETEGSGIDNVVSDFGLAFTSRPTSFTTNYSYVPEMYDDNKTDECDIYVILQVREGEGSNEKRYRLATAWYRSDETINSFTNLTMPLEYGNLVGAPNFMQPSLENNEMPEHGYYSDVNANPTHIIIVFASSAHGASFKGAEGSKLIVKGITLNY